MNRPVRVLPGVALLALLAGCAAVPDRIPREVPEPGAVERQLLRDEAAPRRVRGLAIVRIEGSGPTGSATQAVVVALPDRARLETLGPLGTTIAVVAMRNGEVRIHSLLEQVYAVGQATPETLGRLTQVPLPPEIALRLLAGLPPLRVVSGDPRLVVAARGDTVRVESVEGPWWQRFWTTRAGITAEAGELGDAGGTLLRFRFRDHRMLNATMVPFGLHLDVVTTGTRLSLAYTSLRLGEPIEEELFELPQPTDGRTAILDLGRSPVAPPLSGSGGGGQP
jgi:hypothetical protein